MTPSRSEVTPDQLSHALLGLPLPRLEGLLPAAILLVGCWQTTAPSVPVYLRTHSIPVKGGLLWQ